MRNMIGRDMTLPRLGKRSGGGPKVLTPAGLTGDAWLAWLDQDLETPRFQTETGRKLLEMPYRRPDEDVAAMELIDVVAAVRQRLATPVGGRP